PVVDQLTRDKKWEAPSLQPGEGLIQLVKKAFGEKSALIVTGGDAAAVERARARIRREGGRRSRRSRQARRGRALRGAVPERRGAEPRCSERPHDRRRRFRGLLRGRRVLAEAAHPRHPQPQEASVGRGSG